MKTHTGTLDLHRTATAGRHVTETAYTSGNARQRRRTIRRLKAQGWTVRSWLRTGPDTITTVER